MGPPFFFFGGTDIFLCGASGFLIDLGEDVGPSVGGVPFTEEELSAIRRTYLGRELIKFARSSSLWKPEDPITDQNDRNFRRQIGHQHKGGLTIGDQAYAPARREAAREQDRSQDGRILVFVVVGRVEPERCQSEIKAREGSLLFGFCV